MVIYLDMDGVLADFAQASARVFHKPVESIQEWGFYEALGTTEDGFWKKIHGIGADFWVGIPPYPWYKRIYEECKKTAPTIILTSPSDHESSPQGKSVWLKERLGVCPKGYLMGSSKHHLAHKNALLIDDADHNVDRFRASGGRAILFPRPWNKNKAYSDRALTYTLEELFNIAEDLDV